MRGASAIPLGNNPLWYQEAIIYELHVRAFADGNGDGIGDFRGLIDKLAYLQDLGITAIWLLPFYPSPLKDDGYDIADYCDVHPAYGTLEDFQSFLQAAHSRGLRVITELVINHTSDKHPWFQRARRAPAGSHWRNYYVWSETPDRYQEARIIFKDFESSNWSWDPVGKAYFWHRFYSHQPDLNFDNPEVHREIFKVMDFWLKMGVDGMRLDAVPYLYERERTNCENLPETHAFLKKLRRHVDRRFRNRMLLAEANQWPEEAVAYFGDGDECHMAFHFPVMPRLFMSLRMEDRFPITEIMQQTPPIPDICRWAFFLRNHDELTLEMVTDEERDYMYRVYANDPQARINLGIRRRLAPLLDNNRRRIELMNGLLFSLPGTPIIYYGDEIGMGDNIYLGDRNSVRTPMQWSPDRNAGFSSANPQKLFLPTVIDPEYHFEAVNVEVQQNNPSSLLWWMKRMIALRKRYRAFGQGTLEFLHPENHKVLVFLRCFEDTPILLAANLSRFTQYVELDLGKYQGRVPLEVFGQTRFPPIGELPYFLTLGPHSYHWFSLEQPAEDSVKLFYDGQAPAIRVSRSWKELFPLGASDVSRKYLPAFLRSRQWFPRKGDRIHDVFVEDVIDLFRNTCLVIVQVVFIEGEPESYVIPFCFARGDQAEIVIREKPHAVATRVIDNKAEGVLYDAVWNEDFCLALIKAIARGKRFDGLKGSLSSKHTRFFIEAQEGDQEELRPSILGVECKSTFVNYGSRLILKLFRRLGKGINPDLEIGKFLTERTSFLHLPPVAGSLEYRLDSGEPATVGILQGFVVNEGDAWHYTQGALSNFFERILTRPAESEIDKVPHSKMQLLQLVRDEVPPIAFDLIGPYLDLARLLGVRTAELHLALASEPEDPRFSPEPFTTLYQRSLYQSLRNHSRPIFQALRDQMDSREPRIALMAEKLLDKESEVLRRFESIASRKIDAMRIRCHGDYHLGHVLFTGKDFIIIDFEGDAGRPVSEMRIKHSPLRDVASMLQSFYYAAMASLLGEEQGSVVRAEDRPVLEAWARFWCDWVSVNYLKGYLETAGPAPFLPRSEAESDLLLCIFLLEKAILELGYDWQNRPNWVEIALRGILYQLENHAGIA